MIVINSMWLQLLIYASLNSMKSKVHETLIFAFTQLLTKIWDIP